MRKNIVVYGVTVYLLASNGIGNTVRAAPPPTILETQAIYQLMKDRGYRCLECHDVEKRVVGPPWKEVAAKRRSHKWAEQLIAYKIAAGSVGEYGTVAMPHNEVADEDLGIIVPWILSLWDASPTMATSE